MLGVNPLSFSVFSMLIFCSLWLFGTSSSVAETVLGDKGVVASRSAIASKVGADVMTRGGNAIDAAVATGFALAVTYPSAGNLGGGGFMVIRLSDGSLVTNDHREKAPNLATTDMYLDADGEIIKGLSTRSHLAVGVPGSVAGLIDVLETHGTMSIAEVIQPAIRLARDGFIQTVICRISLALELRIFLVTRHLRKYSLMTGGHINGEIFLSREI